MMLSNKVIDRINDAISKHADFPKLNKQMKRKFILKNLSKKEKSLFYQASKSEQRKFINQFLDKRVKSKNNDLKQERIRKYRTELIAFGTDRLKVKMNKGFGRSRHELKIRGDGGDIDTIHSKRTYINYRTNWLNFTKWFSQKYPNKKHYDRFINGDDLDRAAYINEYLKYCLHEKGLKSTTLKTYRASFSKILDLGKDAFIELPNRSRATRTNNRGNKVDKLSTTQKKYWTTIVEATGLRVNELRNVTGDALIEKDGKYYLHLEGKKHGTKGGRDRTVLINTESQEDLDFVINQFKSAGNKKVFNVPKSLRPHKYRGVYAVKLYLKLARKIKDITNNKEKVILRNDMKGITLDRVACQKVCESLGHSRTNEFYLSYAHKLHEYITHPEYAGKIVR